MHVTYYVNYGIFKHNPRLGGKLWQQTAQEIIPKLPREKFQSEIRYLEDLIQRLPKNVAIKIEKPESNLKKTIKRITQNLPWNKNKPQEIDLRTSGFKLISKQPESISNAFKLAGVPEVDSFAHQELRGLTEADKIDIAKQISGSEKLEKDESIWNVESLKGPKKVGLNDPCLCGSGKKYKYCCRFQNKNVKDD